MIALMPKEELEGIPGAILPEDSWERRKMDGHCDCCEAFRPEPQRSGLGLALFTNSYDAVGNWLTVLELDGTRVTFGYDATYRLVNEQRSGTNAYSTSYGYDPLGNRLTKNDGGQVTGYQYNAANALTVTTPSSGAPTTQSFDANGNLTLQNTGGALTTYSWDGENRLTSVANNSGTEAYSYSTDGLRQKKVTPSGTTNLVWDNQNLLQERDGSLNKLAQYTDFPGFWGGLASQRRSGVSGFYGFDSQSSSRVLVSVGGLVTDSYSYKAFSRHEVALMIVTSRTPSGA